MAPAAIFRADFLRKSVLWPEGSLKRTKMIWQGRGIGEERVCPDHQIGAAILAIQGD